MSLLTFILLVFPRSLQNAYIIIARAYKETVSLQLQQCGLWPPVVCIQSMVLFRLAVKMTIISNAIIFIGTVRICNDIHRYCGHSIQREVCGHQTSVDQTDTQLTVVVGTKQTPN